MQVGSTSIRFSPQAKVIAVAIIVGLAIFLLTHVVHVLTPFIAAIITAYLFHPLVSLLQRRTRGSRAFWIIVLYVLAFSLLSWLWTWVWPRIVSQSEELSTQLPLIVEDINRSFGGRETIELGGGVTLDLAPLEEQIITAISDLGRTLSGSVPGLVFSALETLIFTLVYLIVTFYLLLQAGQLRAWTVRLIPRPYRAEICDLGHQIDRVLGAYVRGQLILIVIMSVLLYIPLSILGVPYALVIAIASGVLEIIPILGPWAAAGIAMLVALFQPEVPFGFSNVGLAGLLAGIYFALRQVEDHFIIPNLMGSLVRLHPAVVIFAILAGGALAGVFGLLISIPVAAVTRILLAYVYRKLVDSPEPPPPPDTETSDTPASKISHAGAYASSSGS
jgi:predicted PurR-regulated permease PerM